MFKVYDDIVQVSNVMTPVSNNDIQMSHADVQVPNSAA
jgi:hypothetical protein